jgi:1-phosphofructokinase family hexose kinase
MIRVVGPNPAMDRTSVLPSIQLDAVNRATRVLALPGGKGLDVARGVRRLGGDVAIYGFVGGLVGQYLRRACRNEGIVDRQLEIDGDSRICTIIVEERTGRTTVLNEPGPTVAPAEGRLLIDTLVGDGAAGDLVVLSGSLPLGLSQRFYAEIVRRVTPSGARVLVDASGPLLRQAVARNPWMVKSNLREFATLTGREFDPADRGALLDDMRRLVEQGVGLVVVTLGAAGLLAMAPEGGVRVTVPAVRAVNPTGSGDAFMAGFAVATQEGQDTERALRVGAACAVANAMSVTPEIPPDADLAALAAAIVVEPL